MKENTSTRRSFLYRAGQAGAGLFALETLPLVRALPPVRAEEARPAPEKVRLLPEMEPLVALLENTPRERLLEEVGSRLRGSLSYRDLLAALLLAGVRNVQPRPYVGFKFHSVLVVNSAHLASMSSPPADRWLPIFWALDYFKHAQAQDIREGNWTMAPVREPSVPPPEKAVAAFSTAMDRWDEEAADAAAASLARSHGAARVFELFWRYGARDYRSIGHKAIFVANSWRTLQCVGWHHAEPVLRSLAYALLQHEGDNPSGRDAEADRPWRVNSKLAREVRRGWQVGNADEAASRQVVEAARNASALEASKKAMDLLNHGVSPRSIWDGIFGAAAEMLLRQPGIISLHSVTTANALHFAYQTSGDEETRLMLLLQAASFLPLFLESARGRGKLSEARLADVGNGTHESRSDDALTDVFNEASRDRARAVEKAYAFLKGTANARSLIDAARRLVFLKGDDAHDYKFSSAVLEDYYHVSPSWRDRYLAASLTLLPGLGHRDNQLVKRARAAFDASRVF